MAPQVARRAAAHERQTEHQSFQPAHVELSVRRKKLMAERAKLDKDKRGDVPPMVPYPSDQLCHQIESTLDVMIMNVDRMFEEHPDATKMQVQ